MMQIRNLCYVWLAGVGWNGIELIFVFFLFYVLHGYNIVNKHVCSIMEYFILKLME